MAKGRRAIPGKTFLRTAKNPNNIDASFIRVIEK